MGMEAGMVVWVAGDMTSDDSSGEGLEILILTSFQATTTTSSATSRSSRNHAHALASLERRNFSRRPLVLASNPFFFRDGLMASGSSRSWPRS